jgi:hypothetical protein
MASASNEIISAKICPKCAEQYHTIEKDYTSSFPTIFSSVASGNVISGTTVGVYRSI